MAGESEFLLATLQDRHLTAPNSIDWNRLLVLAESHSVLPVFCRNYAGDLPDIFVDSFRRQWASSAFMAAELEGLLGQFNREEIPVLPLKGPLLADLLYGSLSLRACDDLDLLVRPEDFARAGSVLGKCGFLSLYDHGNYHHGFLRDGTFVELHFRVASPSLPPLDLDGAWARTRAFTFRSQATRVLAMPDMMLYLVLHGIKHHFSKLIWLLDIARAIELAEEKDIKQLHAMALDLGVEGALLTTAELAKFKFGTVLPDCLDRAIHARPAITSQARTMSHRMLAGPAKPESFVEDLGLFVKLETKSRHKWAHRLRFLLPTQQDSLWAEARNIHPRWLPFLRPWRLLTAHGPAAAMRTFFPDMIGTRHSSQPK